MGFKFVLGGVNAATFGAFICQLIEDYPYIIKPRCRVCLVLDNARIHHAKILKKLRSFMKIFFLPPYSPFLTPIEEFFAITKHYYRKFILSNNDDLDKNALKAL